MIRAIAAAAIVLLAGPAWAQTPAPASEATPALPTDGMSFVELDLKVESASRTDENLGLLVAATATNPGDGDLLILLPEAHVVPPDSMEADCAPTSPRFPATPVLLITRSEVPGTQACDGSQRVPKADWMLSVMLLPAGKSAKIVLQLNEPVRWDGPLHAHLGLSYTTADRAAAREMRRAEKIGLGMVISGLEPGGRVVPPGEGGPAVRRAVELFDRRAVAPPIAID